MKCNVTQEILLFLPCTHTHALTEFHSPLWCWTSSSPFRGSHSTPVSPKGLAKIQPTCFLRAVPTCTSTTLLLPAEPLSLLSVFLLASRQSRDFMAQTAPCSGTRHHLNYWNSQWEKISTGRKDQQDELWIPQYFTCKSWDLMYDPNRQPPALKRSLLLDLNPRYPKDKCKVKPHREI